MKLEVGMAAHGAVGSSPSAFSLLGRIAVSLLDCREDMSEAELGSRFVGEMDDAGSPAPDPPQP